MRRSIIAVRVFAILAEYSVSEKYNVGIADKIEPPCKRAPACTDPGVYFMLLFTSSYLARTGMRNNDCVIFYSVRYV